MSPSETALRVRVENVAHELEETGRVLRWAAASASLEEVGHIAKAIPWHYVRGPAGLGGPLEELAEIAGAIEGEAGPEHGRAVQRADDATLERIEEERAAASGQ